MTREQGRNQIFCNGAHCLERRRHAPYCRRVSGCPPPENFQVWRLRNAIFSTCHEICLRKIDLEPENGKQLQVTIIKITESKENNSIHRLDESGSTRPGGKLPPFGLPASYGSCKIDAWIIERLDRKLADAIGSNIVEKCDVTLSRAIQPLTSDVLRVLLFIGYFISLPSSRQIAHVLK